MVIDGQGILTELLHVVSTPRKGRGKNEPCAQLIPISLSIGRKCIYCALVNLNTKFTLVVPEVVEAILLSNSPCLTDILLKEVASEKDVVGLYI